MLPKGRDNQNSIKSQTELSVITGLVELPKQPQYFRSCLVVSKLLGNISDIAANTGVLVS